MIKIGIISLIFFSLSFYAMINVLSINRKLKKEDADIKTERKLFKRRDSNVYDLKPSRRKK